MTADGTHSNGRSFANYMVNQTPRFEKKPLRRENQVLSKAGIIRKDKRKKVRYL